jgi:hypothetical protein
MDYNVLTTCKEIINKGNLEELKEYYGSLQNLSNDDYRLPWEFIYQQVYLHSCLRKQNEIVEWLRGLYDLFGPIEKIGIRQMFSYGNYLLKK